ncbi:MAG: AI-2E family transporter [Gemmatimonadetes bacterium]|nr:AI-2E family transporter [Gemmatimonadota bacterium]
MVETLGRRLVVTLVSLFFAALIVVFLSRVTTILVLLFISVLLSVYFSAFTDDLVRRLRLPRPVALGLASLVTLAAVVGVGWLIMPPVIAQTQDFLLALPQHAQQLESLLLRLAQKYPLLERSGFGAEGGGLVEGLIDNAGRFIRDSMLPYLRAGGTIVLEIIAVIAMALYLARDPGVYRDGLIALVPPKVRPVARAILADLTDTMRAWIWAQLLSMLLLGSLTVLGLWLLRVPYALAFGVFTGLVAIIPFFGTLVSTALPAIFVLTIGGLSHALAVTALGVGVHLIGANVVAPLIFERRLNMPPLLTILSVLIGGAVLGLLGIVVAVPLLAALLVVIRHVLLTQIYGDHDPRSFEPAVLVSTTGARRAVAMTPR